MTDFLRAFWGSDTGCFRQFHDTDKSVPGRNLTGSFVNLRDDIQAYASAGYGSFFIPNGGGHSDADIIRFNAVWIDLDGGKGHNWPERWHVNPSIVTVRGGNYHAYWLLEPGTITDADTFRQVQKRLIRFYNSDKPIHNPARVMRLPDMPHMKDPENTEGYRVHHFAPDVRYSLDAVTVGLPEIAAAAVTVSAGPDSFNDDALAQSYAVDYLTSRAPLAIEGQEGDSTTYGVCCAVRDFGVSEPVALDLLLAHWNDRCTPPWDAADLVRVLTHAYRYAQNSAGHKLEAVRAFGELAAPAAPVIDPDVRRASEIYAEIVSALQYKVDSLVETVAGIDEPLHAVVDPQVILDIATRSFWSGSKGCLFVTDDKGYPLQFRESDAYGLLQRRFGRVISNQGEWRGWLESVYEMQGGGATEARKLAQAAIDIPRDILLDFLKDERQCESTVTNIDLFGDRLHVPVRNNAAHIVIPFTPYEPARPVESVRADIVDDYKAHFPQFDEVIDFIADARVSLNRKKAYLWFHCDSDWGKGFFMNIFNTMRAGVETSMSEVQNMVKGSPVGKSAGDFRTSLALMLDEVKTVNTEFKQLQDTLSFSPKNQLTVQVPIYAKLMFSAETIDSLATSSGVEDQFANRISVIRAHGNLTYRSKRLEMGGSVYQDHIRQYACDRLNDRIAHYVSLGYDEAARKAEAALEAFHKRHGIANLYGRMSDNIFDLTESFKSWCMDRRMPGRGYQTTVYNHDTSKYVLKNAPKAFEEWIRDSFSHSESRTINYKKNDVLRLMSDDGKGSSQYWCDGRNVRGVLFRFDTGVTPAQNSNVVDIKKGG